MAPTTDYPPPSKLPTKTKGHLLRIVGVGFGIAVIVGNTVGSGILRTPGEIAARLQSSRLVIAVWLIGGLYAFFCTLSVTELATMLPRAGGWYVYSRRAFGEYAGFLVGSCDWIVQAASLAYISIAFAEFAAELQPAFRGNVKLIAIATLSFLAALNWLGLRAGSRTQDLTSLIKSLALVAFVVACFAISPRSGVAAASAPPIFLLPRGGLLLAFVIALQPILVSYDGWYGAIYFVEDDEDPIRNLPRSSIMGVIACIAIYLLVNAALLHVLPMTTLVASQMPAADAALAIFGAHGKQVILVISLLATLSAVNAVLMMMPRILFAMSRDGLLPRAVASVNPGGTPAIALLLASLAGIALILSGSFEKLVAVASILFVVVYLSGFCALFALRIREPNLARPFKLWGYPWTNLAVLVASVAFLVASIFGDLKNALFTLILIALSVPIYFLLVKGISRREAATITAAPDVLIPPE